MLPLAHALVDVRDVLWGQGGAWVEESTSLVLLGLLFGAIVANLKQKQN